LRIEGIILAAGKGTRMMPLTGLVPKPLLPVTGVPMLDVVAGKLLREGASRVHINLFHLGGMIRDHALSKGWPAVFHEEAELLDTGGGIGNMAAELAGADCVLLHNGDVISSFGFDRALEAHLERDALVTLILMEPGEGGRTPPPAVRMDGDGSVLDISRSSGGLGYTGMAVISGRALERFPARKKGLVPVLLEMIGENRGSVSGYVVSRAGGASWGEVGSPDSYLDLHRRIMLEHTVFDEALPPPALPLRVGAGASIDPGARWKGFLDVGDGVKIEKDTELEDCVLLDGAVVLEGARLSSAVAYGEKALEVER
jgi:mannose-1-phosphate guanylyltransferase